MRILIIPLFPRSVLTYLLSACLLQVPHLLQGQHKQQEREVMALFDSLGAKARLYSGNHPIEKIYIHFDRPVYALGEESWYKAYVVRGSDLRATDISSVLYVDWISPSGNIVQHQRLKIENGGAVGDFTINALNEDGIYTVRAYTNWMRNEDPDLFFAKKIQVFNPRRKPEGSVPDTSLAKIDVQFFPEGGTLVAGIKTQIAFKAIDMQGKGVDVSGRIVSDQNKFVTSFRSVHNGMGVFPIITEAHRSYRAILQNGDVIPLPRPSTEGLVLGASNLNPQRIFVSIQAAGYKHEIAYLVGQSRGSICYTAPIKIDKHSNSFSIAKQSLPEGVLHLTLFDSDGNPQCQRKVFIKKDNAKTIAIEGDKEEFSPRDSIELKFKITDLKGDSDSTSLSIAVTDADFIDSEPLSENIYTQLLLQSDLKGFVEKPGWYFESNTADRAYMLDIVMLTHGWSRYDWKKILSPTYAATFKPEKGITLKGQILLKDKPLANVPFVLTMPKQYDNTFKVYESDSLGRFVIPDLDVSDSALVIFRVMGKKKGAVEKAVIALDTLQDPAPPVERIASRPIQGERNELFDKLLARFLKTGVWNLNEVRVLDEIVIRAKRLEVIPVSRLGIVAKPGPEDMKLTAYQFIRRYALNLPFSKMVTNEDGDEVWTGVWIVIDGFERKGNPFLELSSVPADQIDHVIVSGTPRHGYFISLTTKDPPPEKASGTIEQFVNGFDIPREFYHPKYGRMDPSTFGPDNRVTLYWNPQVLTTSDGTATVKFYNTDSTRRLLVTIEGVAEGVPVYATKILGRD
jgi:hypothetical protein